MRLPPGCHEARTAVAGLLAGASPDIAATRLGLPLPASLARAVDKRRAEFLAGRWCAREALRLAGLADPPPIAIGAEREPLWPAGWVGSISHSRGEAWAVAAPAGRLRGIGIDLECELDGPRWQRLLPRLLAEGESLPAAPAASAGADDGARPGWNEALRAALLFAAKEAFYKCVAPLGGLELGFADARLGACVAEGASAGVEAGTLEVQLLRTAGAALAAGLRVQGRYEVDARGARCCLWLPAA